MFCVVISEESLSVCVSICETLLTKKPKKNIITIIHQSEKRGRFHVCTEIG